MGGGENPFLEYLRAHPDADRAVLKQLFRMLAKRTHPDLGGNDESAFIRLRSAYIEVLEEPPESPATAARSPATAANRGDSPRIRVLDLLQRYTALLPSTLLEFPSIPPRPMQAFEAAREAAKSYSSVAWHALNQYHDQFHRRRRENARYPEVTTKHKVLMHALFAMFDNFNTPGATSMRLAQSLLSEIHPVTDFDPAGSPELRSNRSAAARSAIYVMKRWMTEELDLGPPPEW